MMKRLVVIPTFNERENLARFLARVRLEAPDADVVIVDDNSPDGTGAIGDAIARRDARVRVVHRPRKLGLGTAYRDAFSQGLADGYDHFVQMDADHSHDPRHLPDFFRELDAGADVVIGSRNIRGGGVIGWGLDRHVLSKGGSLYARSLLGLAVSDLTSGYKAFNRRALETIDLAQVRSRGYAYQIETTYRAHQRGLRLHEIPIVFVDRTHGCSKMSRDIFLEALVRVWQLRLQSAR